MGCVREWVARRYRRVNTRAHRRGRQEEAGGGGRRREEAGGGGTCQPIGGTHWRLTPAHTERATDRARESARARERERKGRSSDQRELATVL